MRSTQILKVQQTFNFKKLLCYNLFFFFFKHEGISHTIWPVFSQNLKLKCPFPLQPLESFFNLKEREKGTEQWKQCILSHSHVSCNHLLFPLVTSASAKFMWPLPWPLTSMEKHLFEGKDNWHDSTEKSIDVIYALPIRGCKKNAVPEADATESREHLSEYLLQKKTISFYSAQPSDTLSWQSSKPNCIFQVVFGCH